MASNQIIKLLVNKDQLERIKNNSSVIVENKNLRLIKDILAKYKAELGVFDIVTPKSKLTK